jgi:ureidoglycolate lyase
MPKATPVSRFGTKKPGMIHELKVEPLTAKAFKPFGELLDPKSRSPLRRSIVPDRGFQILGKTVVATIWQPFQGRTFTQLERHFAVTQGFIPLSGSPSVVAVAPPTDPKDPNDIPDPNDVRAFLIDGSVGFRYKIGTWHSLNRYLLRPPGATFVILNVDPNPTEVVDYRKRFGITFKVVP